MPRRNDGYRNSFSGSFGVSFSRSSTIDERTWATLRCGISTLLTMSDRLFRSRSTDLQQIVGIAGQRIGFLHRVDALHQVRKCLALSGEWVASVMWMKAIRVKPSASLERSA